jgi:hypothetical protein
VRVPAQAVAVAMIVIFSMVVAVAVAVVQVAAGFSGFVVHQLDSNRDLVCLTARIRGGSVGYDGANRCDRRERTRWPKRN